MDSDQALKLTNKLYEKLKNRRPEIEEFDRYYDGEQPLKYASPEWSDFHKDRYKGFADNWCSVIVDALNERLHVSGFQVGSERTDLERILWDDWRKNDMEAQSSMGFLQSISSKRSAVIVWGDDNDEPVSTWEHPSQVIVDYDPLNRRKRRAALKSWVEDGVEYATLYTPDTLFRWQRSSTLDVKNGKTASGLYVNGAVSDAGASWQPREDKDGHQVDNPLGVVPVVEIGNRPRLRRGPTSDIAGAMAMQDAINLLWAYLFGAADHASLPARVVMGQEQPKVPVYDSSGRKTGERSVDIKDLKDKRLLWLTGKDASIGQYAAAKLDVFTDVIEINIGHLGGQSRTPAHYFVANKGLSNINGETLTATETPLVKKTEEFQLYSGHPLSEIFALYSLVRGEEAFAREITADSVQWKNPAIRSESQLADAMLKKKQMGYPLRYLMEMEGLSPTQIDVVMRQIEEERMMDPLAEAARTVRESTGDVVTVTQ